MKRLKNILVGMVMLISINVYSQVKDDSFYFTNAKMNYLLDVTRNDILVAGDSIKSIIKIDGNNYTYSIVGNRYILIQDTTTNVYAGQLRYFIYNNSIKKDSAVIYFFKNSTNVLSYVNNETNSDSVVNHFDLFQIGIFYNQIGSPRLLNDTGDNFVPYKRSLWNQSNAVSNASTADINGDGFVNEIDIRGIEDNYLKSRGTYKPTLSPPSDKDILYSNYGKDTIRLDSQFFRLRVPINLHLASPTSFYGLGYSYSVKYYDSNLKSYVNYTDHYFNKTKPWAGDAIINKAYKNSNNSKNDILNCRTSKQNEPVDDTLFGLVEVVVDEVLIGIPNPGNQTSLIVEVYDVAMIDKDYNFLPISPKSDTIIIINKGNNSHTSINIQSISEISVYPTIFNHDLIIKNTTRENLNIKLYDLMGRLIYQDSVSNLINHIHIENLNSGIYFLTIDEKNRVFKLIKN